MFLRFLALFLFLLLTGFPSFADSVSDPLPRVGRVLVIANASDPASLELAQLYMQARNLPPANLLRLAFPNPINIGNDAFKTGLLVPLYERLDRLGDNVDYLVFMRGVPYRVGGKVSLPTAAIYQGRQKIRPLNPYYRAETPFKQIKDAGSSPFRLATMLTGYTVYDTEQLIKSSLVRYPSAAAAGTFYLCEGVGPRGMRAAQIEPTLKLFPQYQARGERVQGADVRERMDILGQFTGATRLKLKGNRYLPGSIVDNVTSFGGYLLDPKNQMSILTFIQHGACGAYGTVHEPTNDLRRWADLTLPVRYASGFNLAESYYQTVADWRFGVLVGDPLMAPFAKPADIQMNMENQTIETGKKASVHVTLSEAEKGTGVGRAAFWLDDQVKLFDWLPALPVGSQCTLKIQAGDQVLLQKQLSITEQPEPLKNVLAALTGNVGQIGKILRHGSRGDQLSLVMMPLIGPDGKMVPVSYEFTLKNSGEEAITQGTLAQRVVLAKAMVLDFGHVPPVPGDKITLEVGGHTRTVQAFSSSSMDDLLQQLVNYLSFLPEFRQTGDYVLKIRKSPVDPPNYTLLAIPKKTATGKTFPLAVSIRRAKGSAFAKGLENEKPYWKTVPVGGFSQITLTPKLPISQAQFTLDIPPEQLVAGTHKLTCVATSFTGAETVTTTQLTVTPAPGNGFSAKIPTTVYNLGQTLMVTMRHSPNLAKAWPQLVVDGRVVCAWSPGTLIGQFVIDGKLICPGEHRVWIEWAKEKDIAGVAGRRTPIARSSPIDIYVRRPLAAGVRISPDVVKAGTKTTHLTGAYLRKGLQIMTERDSLPMARNQRDPGKWTLDISRLQPGVYQLYVIGDPRTDDSGAVATPLVIQ